MLLEQVLEICQNLQSTAYVIHTHNPNDCQYIPYYVTYYYVKNILCNVTTLHSMYVAQYMYTEYFKLIELK